MDLLQLPLHNHYVIVTSKGFSTVMVQDPHTFTLQDIPLRFVSNACASDTSDRKTIKEFEAFMDRFRYAMLKCFGVPALTGLRVKDIFKRFEMPAQVLLDSHSAEVKSQIVQALQDQDPAFKGKEPCFQQSPLFVFTRGGMVDPDQ